MSRSDKADGDGMSRTAQELIYTKVVPPTWMGGQIGREALLARLDAALHRRLTLIHAPAGYGKTSLLSQWRERLKHQSALIAWLTLEKEDGDRKRLAQYLWLALDMDGADVDTPRGGDDAPKPLDMPPRAALSAIINRLVKETRPAVLIFDDFHRAEGPDVADFLQGFIRLAPDNCHFVIASRDYPQLGQSVLAAEEQLLDFGVEDLKFSVSETEALLKRNDDLKLDDGDVRRIFKRTEGWPIALQLTSLSLRGGADHRRIVESFSGPSSELARYLSEQVLLALPPDVQEIVTRTALIDHLTGDVVNMLCEREDGWLVLEQLEHQGVFLTPLSADRRAYRYHQLFAEYLRERLSRCDGARFRALHRTAAEWFAATGRVAEAVNHAAQAEDDDLLASILDDAGGWRLIPEGRMEIISFGLDRLSPSLIAARPRLALANVYLEIKRGEMKAARADYDRFVADAAGADLSADLWTEIRLVGDVLTEYEDAPVTLEDLLEREALIRTLPSNDHLMLGNVCESLGAKYFLGGWLERALEPILAARAHHQALDSLYSDLFTRFLEARIKRAQGRLDEASSVLETARELIESNFGARSDLAANCAAYQAELLYEQDRLPEAQALLDWALPHMEQSDGWFDVYAVAFFTAARAAAAESSLDEARAMIARARRVAGQRRLRQLELLSDLCELDLLINLRWDDVAARRYADDIGLDALADDMAEESPVYRQVAVAASLCRAKLALVERRERAALEELSRLKGWASQHGAGRLLIDIAILTACAHRLAGAAMRAQSQFDDAVGMAMFQGLVRPFVDSRRFIRLAPESVHRRSRQVDRFRDQFLQGIRKSLARQLPRDGEQGLLNDAEVTILEHLNCGYTNKEIARLIDMSPDTVKYRLKSVFRKLGVNKRRDAVRVSRERGLIDGLKDQSSGIG